MSRVQYSVPDHGDERFGLPRDAIGWKTQPDWLATEAAEDYFNNHDGWEAKWPLVVAVFVDDKEVGRYRIKREDEPQFYVEIAVCPHCGGDADKQCPPTCASQDADTAHPKPENA